MMGIQQFIIKAGVDVSSSKFIFIMIIQACFAHAPNYISNQDYI